MYVLTDNSMRCNTLFWDVSRGFGAWCQLICVTGSCIGIILLMFYMEDNPGVFGQSVFYLMQMTEIIQWSLRQMINIDSSMSSVERNFIMIDCPKEAADHLPNDPKSYIASV
jgi:ATP-binding cassette subfamily C (CFTR/MRP) protein 4